MHYTVHIKISLAISFFLLFPQSFLFAQFYDSGQDPSSIHWKQIRTTNFQVIYPEDFQKEALRMANILQYAYQFDSVTLNHPPLKISVILHTKTVISNGITAWAPKRIDFYTCPPQDNYAQDWLEQLAIYEFRHAIQINKINQGLTEILYNLFGQQITVAVLGLYIPLWFLEGDAVCTETALSNSGRGRIPSFEMEIRAQLLEKKKYSYDKAVFGSYKDYIPDYFHLGYLLVAGARKEFGPSVWQSALDRTGKNPFMITPFNSGIKKVTGLSKVKLYNHILNNLDTSWMQQKQATRLTEYKIISKKNKAFTSYQLPYYLNDSTVLAVKSGLDYINTFVAIDRNTSKETKILIPGVNYSNSFSYSNGMIVWSEMKPDIFWDNRSFSIIRMYNLKTKKIKTITYKSRYFAPSLSAKGDRIAVVEITTNNIYNLTILNVSNGKVLKKISLPDNDFIMTPKWDNKDERIVAVALNKEKGKTLVVINPETSEIKYATPFTFTEISNPLIFENYILFSGAYSGISNIYAFDLSTNKTYQVSSCPFGADFATIRPDGKKIIFSNYTSNGYQIAEMDLNPDAWIPLENIKDNSIKLYEALEKQEKGKVITQNIPDSLYKTKIYSKALNLFNIHSWGPVSIDVNNQKIYPGFSILSQNLLNTAVTSVGYVYYPSDKFGKYYADITYKEFFPVFDLGIDYAHRSDYLTNPVIYQNHHTDTIKNYKYGYDETNLHIGMSLPFNLTSGKYLRGITPSIIYTQTYRKLTSDPDSLFSPSMNKEYYIFNQNLKSLTYGLYAYNTYNSSPRDIIPKYGEIFNITFANDPSALSSSSIFAAYMYLYLPGFVNHHGFKFYTAYQHKVFGDYNYLDIILHPAGYNFDYLNNGFIFSANYTMPLLYPDFHLGSLFYIQRIKANYFYNYAATGKTLNDYNFNSYGFDVTLDINLLRFYAPFNMGVRTAFVSGQGVVNQFLINVSFY